MFYNVLRQQAKGLLALFLYCSIITSAEAVEFMPVSEVKTGMEGIAKTVVVGDEISTFNVEILGVMKDRGPSGDLILARFSGPVMDTYGGIAHGMSGSPVYIDGKLVGAVAYGWGFADAKVGMITPIEDMVKLWNIPYEKDLPKPWKGDGEIIPIATPLMAYGFDEASLDFMKTKLKSYNFVTYNTASGTGDDVQKTLEPGGSVAALLVNGDLKLGAIGTVTHVDGDHVVAFGHSFLKRGAMDYFMHNAHIFTVVKSYQSSFKLGSMGALVGGITEDRGAGIAGITGKPVLSVPVRMTFLDKDTGSRRNVAVNVVEDEELTPVLAATSIYSFLNKTLDRSGEGTAKITLHLENGNKYEPLKRTNMFYSSSDIAEKSVDELYNIIDILMNNTYVPYEVTDIKVDVEVTKERETAAIVDASASPAIVSPGDDIYVKVKLRPFRGKEVEKDLTFTVPKDQPLGKMTLEIRGGGVVPLPYLIEKQKYNLTDEIIRRIKVYKDFDEFYKTLRKTDTNNELVVEILEEGVSMVDEDGESDSKKAKLQEVEKKPWPGDIRKPEKSTLDKSDDEEAVSKLVTEYVISGDGQISIEVVAPEKKEKALLRLAKERTQEKKAVISEIVTDKAVKESKEEKAK